MSTTKKKVANTKKATRKKARKDARTTKKKARKAAKTTKKKARKVAKKTKKTARKAAKATKKKARKVAKKTKKTARKAAKATKKKARKKAKAIKKKATGKKAKKAARKKAKAVKKKARKTAKKTKKTARKAAKTTKKKAKKVAKKTKKTARKAAKTTKKKARKVAKKTKKTARKKAQDTRRLGRRSAKLGDDIDKVMLKDIKKFSPKFLNYKIAKETAEKYELKTDKDKDSFKVGWELSKIARQNVQDFKDGVYGKDFKGPVEDAYQKLVELCRVQGPLEDEHYKNVIKRPTSGKYVIFSDHHWAPEHYKQNFFKLNQELYIDALEAYKNAGYTVIENGDVEETFLKRYDKETYKKWLKMTFGELKKERLKNRLKVLKKTMEDPFNAKLYEKLGELSEKGQLLRTVGNHDVDLSRAEFLKQLRTKIKGLEVPADYILLTGNDGVDYVICHGHQYDHYTNPINAPYMGELIAESISWAYQGPDRNWKWDEDKGNSGQWLDGTTAFKNELVDTEHLEELFTELFKAHGHLSQEEILENLMGNNVAWEYFINGEYPLRAYTLEVLKGKGCFKYRHMDEIALDKAISALFEENAITPPRLVLGHTHEVRINPKRPNGTTSNHILNSGAAGRFENLIWGIEIDNGEARVISWTYQDKDKKTRPERFVYEEYEAGLVPRNEPEEL